MDTNPGLVFLLYVFVIISIVLANREFTALRRKLLRQERQLDAILKQLNVDWQSEVDSEVLRLIRTGAKLDAVNAYEESIGVKLKDAVTYVQSFWDGDD